ncbi:uncharacterized protein [Elaeis guineensis]|uniref:Uncharacterized protein LOC105043734 isoform X3 n=2 Tax=Elaeis guineensis var. tenera TaxID=51953 RepID=A0A6I9R393_ELAGV|nr:uncharacterized protein LOC105043734 isoform X3 [Elaeis guineensis]
MGNMACRIFCKMRKNPGSLPALPSCFSNSPAFITARYAHPSPSGLLSMDRWTGVLKVSLGPNHRGPFFKVAASLLLSHSKALIVPSVNAIFFNGDRVEGTGDPVIERLSDSRNIAELLVSKLGSSANAWVVDASTFNGPFAVYKEFIPSVNSRGEPKRYDPNGFPASSSVVTILSKCVEEVKSLISCSVTKQIPTDVHFPASTSPTRPKTIILGFSKGGTVVNQLVTELAYLNTEPARDLMSSEKPSSRLSQEMQDCLCPVSEGGLLFSISEFHYVDAGLNCAGAYLTDRTAIRKIVEHLLLYDASISFTLHGTPRQWCDRHRPWICKEKDILRRLLEDEARRCEGKLKVTERFYFINSPPNLQMHFEIIETMDIS